MTMRRLDSSEHSSKAPLRWNSQGGPSMAQGPTSPPMTGDANSPKIWVSRARGRRTQMQSP